MLILFMIEQDLFGEDASLMCWAETPDEAIGYWHDYYNGWWDADLPAVPEKIFVVPTRSPRRGALSWHAEGGIREVRAPIAIAKQAFNLNP